MIRLVILFSFSPFLLLSQYDHINVFSQLEGQELIDNVVNEFKPSFVLNNTQSKDTLYKVVFEEADFVECIYSGYKAFLDPNLDPSQAVFALDINMEHSFPRSKGASSGNPLSDMHHLYPSRVSINSDRADDVYGEIDDNQTQKWYKNDMTRTQIPLSDRDAYSEDADGIFEPRESVKGDIARAQFYFYTMYKSQADNADPNYFQSMRETLCNWHDLDPVDSLEWHRTYKIAAYQDDKPNPFVLDCRLARIFCDSFNDNCVVLSTKETPALKVKVYPNILSPLDVLNIELEKKSPFTWSIYTADGLLLKRGKENGQNTKIQLDLTSGIYFLNLESKQGYSIQKLIVR